MQGLEVIINIAVLIMSIVIHEVSHGVAANNLGDPTAKHAGRLTMNPIPHIDPVGSVIVPVFGYLFGGFLIGWAKPVPYNPYNLSNQRWGPAIVGLAGPLSNILIAVVFAIFLRSFGVNFGTAFVQISYWIIAVNIWLALFNLIPIPPLDGSKLLFSLFPARYLYIEEMFEQYGFFILLVLVFVLPGILLGPLSNLATIIVNLLIGG